MDMSGRACEEGVGAWKRGEPEMVQSDRWSGCGEEGDEMCEWNSKRVPVTMGEGGGVEAQSQKIALRVW